MGRSEADPRRDPRLTKRALRTLHTDLGVQTLMVSDVSVPRALHALAEEEGATLLVVGSTSRDVHGRALPGSTADRLFASASCPVALAPQGYERTTVRAIAVGFAAMARAVDALPDGVAVTQEMHVDDPAEVLLRVLIQPRDVAGDSHALFGEAADGAAAPA